MGGAVSNAVSNARIVHVFEFEYHSSSYWSAHHPERRPRKTTPRLSSRTRHECFWTGADLDGCLVHDLKNTALRAEASISVGLSFIKY